MPKAKKKSGSRTKHMSREHAEALVHLLRTADGYARHPDVEAVLGYQESSYLPMAVDELISYLQDNVLDPDGEGMSARDHQTMAKGLRKIADSLDKLAAIPFALPATAMAKRLREAAARLSR